MDVSNGTENSTLVLWEAAGKMAAEWLSEDNSSLEAAVLSKGAIRLLQAVIYELGLSGDEPEAALSACYSFLATEQAMPGSVADRLLSSKEPRVITVGKDIQTKGEYWVLTESQNKNLIALTALMNLPMDRPG